MSDAYHKVIVQEWVGDKVRGSYVKFLGVSDSSCSIRIMGIGDQDICIDYQYVDQVITAMQECRRARQKMDEVNAEARQKFQAWKMHNIPAEAT